jgi:hypothetical protein
MLAFEPASRLGTGELAARLQRCSPHTNFRVSHFCRCVNLIERLTPIGKLITMTSAYKRAKPNERLAWHKAVRACSLLEKERKQ